MSSDQAAAAPAKKVSKPKVAPAHPKYIEMISAAIRALNERSGSSRQAISKWITANYKISETSASTHIKLALKRGVTSGTLIHTKGLGASGSFKLVKKVEKPKKKKVIKKKPAAKKPAKKTKPKTKKAASPKKAAKKPAAKKDKKPAKKAAKKPTTKKSTPKKTTTKKDKVKKSKAKPAKKVVKPKKTAKK